MPSGPKIVRMSQDLSRDAGIEGGLGWSSSPVATMSQDLSRDAGIEGFSFAAAARRVLVSQDLSRDAGIEGSSGARSSGSTVPSQDLSRDAGIEGGETAPNGLTDCSRRKTYPATRELRGGHLRRGRPVERVARPIPRRGN